MNKLIIVGLGTGALLSIVAIGGYQKSPVDAEKEDSSTTNPPSISTNTPSNMQTAGPNSGDTIVTLETDKGSIKIKLFTEEVPETTKNFIELSKAGKYDGVPFHRIIDDFMIQTGDFTAQNGTGGHSYKGPGTMIEDEFSSKLKHLKGTLSMANGGPNTNGSQFFIVTAEEGTPHLNNLHSVFGQVFEGQDVVDAISTVETGFQDKPLSPLSIKSIEIDEY
jgi:peptidyl-prolyl cis-trans isomerase B (cyclophilin B)